MERKRCAHCGCPLNPNGLARNQNYCGNNECQRARKRLWQKQKRATDPDYKTNQKVRRSRQSADVAKMDASASASSVGSGS